MLGNEALAERLKKKLEGAREAKARTEAEGDAAAAAEDGGRQREETVVLTRTDAKGMTRPVHATEEEAATASGGGGRRRKKEKVATHDKDGKRARYFADDDRHDLKALFEREKLSTAEDQVRGSSMCMCFCCDLKVNKQCFMQGGFMFLNYINLMFSF